MKPILPALAAVFALALLTSPSEAGSRVSGMSAETFANKVATSDQFEIQSSQLALQKSQNEDIRLFAQQMIHDHTDTTQKLRATLKQAKLPEPRPQLDQQRQALLTRLESVSGTAFNRRYVADQVAGHQQAVDLLESYSKSGGNLALKKFALEGLPLIRQHLQMAYDLRSGRNLSVRR